MDLNNLDENGVNIIDSFQESEDNFSKSTNTCKAIIYIGFNYLQVVVYKTVHLIELIMMALFVLVFMLRYTLEVYSINYYNKMNGNLEFIELHEDYNRLIDYCRDKFNLYLLIIQNIGISESIIYKVPLENALETIYEENNGNDDDDDDDETEDDDDDETGVTLCETKGENNTDEPCETLCETKDENDNGEIPVNTIYGNNHKLTIEVPDDSIFSIPPENYLQRQTEIDRIDEEEVCNNLIPIIY